MNIDRIIQETGRVFPRELRKKNLKEGDSRPPDLPLELFEAYYSCRKNKRNSSSALTGSFCFLLSGPRSSPLAYRSSESVV